MPMFTTTSATMRPRRLRSSMKRVAIMAPLGTHDPRWSVVRPTMSAAAVVGVGCRRRRRCSLVRPQSGRDLEEPGLERGMYLLEAVDGDTALDQESIHLGHHFTIRPRSQAHPEPARTDFHSRPPLGAGPVGGGAVDLELWGSPRRQAATPSRWRMPIEYLDTLSSARWAIPTRSSETSTRPLAAASRAAARIWRSVGKRSVGLASGSPLDCAAWTTAVTTRGGGNGPHRPLDRPHVREPIVRRTRSVVRTRTMPTW